MPLVKQGFVLQRATNPARGRMASKPERPQGFVFAKQAAAADVAGGGSRRQAVVAIMSLAAPR